MAAEASRHDEIAIEACAQLAAGTSDRVHDLPGAERWIRLGAAILERFPGHPLLEARLAASRSAVRLAMSENNLANALHEVGRDREAEESIRRAKTIIGGALGDDTARYALASIDECEILTALGRFDEARAAAPKALQIWKEEGASAFLLGYGLLDRGKVEAAEGNASAARAGDLARQARRTLAGDPAASRVVVEIEAWQRSRAAR